jgi:hypothetical protein
VTGEYRIRGFLRDMVALSTRLPALEQLKPDTARLIATGVHTARQCQTATHDNPSVTLFATETQRSQIVRALNAVEIGNGRAPYSAQYVQIERVS